MNVSPSLFQDYKTYLDFVLALENRKEPAALQYIFKLLDMENQGHLNVFSLNYFFRVSAAHASVKRNQKDWFSSLFVFFHSVFLDHFSAVFFFSSGHSGTDQAARTGAGLLPGCKGTYRQTAPYVAVMAVGDIFEHLILSLGWDLWHGEA